MNMANVFSRLSSFFRGGSPKPNPQMEKLQATIQELKNTIESGIPIGTRVTPSLGRVDRTDLEAAYNLDPVYFNGINKLAQLIMSAGYKLEMPNARVGEFFNDFLENIGRVGNAVRWYDLLTLIFRYQFIYGPVYVELIHGKRKKKKIVDLDLLDSKRMDYAKTPTDKIALDKYGNPLGFVQKVPWSHAFMTRKGLPEPPEEVSIKAEEVFFPPEKIAHFGLYTKGDRFYPIGLIEPSYTIGVWKRNLETAYFETAKEFFGSLIWKIGDAKHEPTPEQIKHIKSTAKDMKYGRHYFVPWYYNADLIQLEHPDRLRQILEYCIDQQAASMGLPKPFITGAGEATNRATLNIQYEMFQLSIKDKIERTCRNIEFNIFKRIAETNGFKKYPKIVWNKLPIDGEDFKAKESTPKK